MKLTIIAQRGTFVTIHRINEPLQQYIDTHLSTHTILFIFTGHPKTYTPEVFQ